MAFFGSCSKKQDNECRATFHRHRRFYFCLFILVCILSAPGSLRAAELVMFEDPGCEWCQIWDREVGKYYETTKTGKSVPLRRVLINAPRSGDLKTIKNIRYTPTFVVVHHGNEIGRITGYPGEEFFWGYLEEILEKIDRRQGSLTRTRRKIFN